ncbi:hypothetical protein Tco_1509498, partial [Tanacetum coccineum]
EESRVEPIKEKEEKAIEVVATTETEVRNTIKMIVYEDGCLFTSLFGIIGIITAGRNWNGGASWYDIFETALVEFKFFVPTMVEGAQAFLGVGNRWQLLNFKPKFFSLVAFWVC